MNNILKTIFYSFNFTEEQINSLSSYFCEVLIYEILGSSEPKLTNEEFENVQNLFQENKIDEALSLIKLKYTEEEWSIYIKEIGIPIAKSFINDAILKI